MTDPALFWPLAFVAAVLVGLSKGGLPIVAMLAVPLMALVMNPIVAAGLLLPVYIISDMGGLWAYRKAFDKRVLKILVPATTIGVTVGGLTASIVPEWLVTLLIGLIGTVFALFFWFRNVIEGAPGRPRWIPGLIWGSMAGFTSFVSHAGAPPYQVYVLPLRLRKEVYAGTTQVLFSYVNLIKLIPYWMLGTVNAGSVKTALVLALPAMIAVWAGVRLVRILPEKLFFQLALWALLLVSLKLIWDGVAGS